MSAATSLRCLRWAFLSHMNVAFLRFFAGNSTDYSVVDQSPVRLADRQHIFLEYKTLELFRASAVFWNSKIVGYHWPFFFVRCRNRWYVVVIKAPLAPLIIIFIHHGRCPCTTYIVHTRISSFGKQNLSKLEQNSCFWVREASVAICHVQVLGHVKIDWPIFPVQQNRHTVKNSTKSRSMSHKTYRFDFRHRTNLYSISKLTSTGALTCWFSWALGYWGLHHPSTHAWPRDWTLSMHGRIRIRKPRLQVSIVST